MLMACAGTLLALPTAIKLAPFIGALDNPKQDTRRIHRQTIPRIGGLAISIIFILIFLLQGHYDKHSLWFIFGIIVLIIVGIIDDTRGMPARYKIIGHLAAMLCAVVGSGLVVPYIPLPLIDKPPIYSFLIRSIITVFTGIGVINAFNLIDGLDGLASGLGAIAASGVAILAGLSGNIDLCLTSLILVGCLFAMLAFNSHPARVFLGDTGSMIIGYLIACFSISLVSNPINANGITYSPLLPLLLVIIPCADCLWVMGSRIIRDRSPFRADRTHVHHRILGLGVQHQHAVLLLLSISIFLTVISIILRAKNDDILFLTLLCLVQSVVGGIRFLVHARSYRRIAVKALRLQRHYTRATTPKDGIYVGTFHERIMKINNLVLKSTIIALCTFYSIGGLRPTELLGWGALGLLIIFLILIIFIKNKNHHFIFFITFVSLSYISLCSNLQIHQIHENYFAIGLNRILILTAFASAIIELSLSHRIHELISTPLELVIVSFIISILIFVKYQREDVYLPAVASASVALFVVLKGSAGSKTYSQLAMVSTLIALLVFVLLQGFYCGFQNPVPRLFHSL